MRKTLEVRVKTSPLKLSHESRYALARLKTFDWILFTSKNAVEYFFSHVPCEFPANVRIAAVGPVTASALKKRGLHPAVTPAKATVKDMVRSLGTIRGRNILFPRSSIAPSDIVRSMRVRGARVRVIPLYTTQPSPLTRKEKSGLMQGKYSTLVFKSPSGARGLLSQLTPEQKRHARTIPAQCIGPTSAKAARAAGFRKVKDMSL